MDPQQQKEVLAAHPRRSRERVVGAFFQAVTYMAGLRPGLVPAHMRKQMELAGIDEEMLGRVSSTIRSLKDWPYAWEAEGDRRIALSDVRSAAAAYYLAQRPLLTDSALKQRLYAMSRQCYEQIDHASPLEKIAVEHDGETISGYLQMPSRPLAGPAPLCLIIPGITATKEEMHLFAEAMIVRGYAACRIDNPAYGETTGNVRSASLDNPVAVMQHLADDPRIDADDIHLFGVSMGGLFALSAAARSNPATVTVVSAPFDPIRYADRFPISNVTALMHMTKSASYRELMDHLRSFSLTNVADHITAPVLLYHGGRDGTIPASEMERTASSVAGRAQTHLFPEEFHACLGRLGEVLAGSLEFMNCRGATAAEWPARNHLVTTRASRSLKRLAQQTAQASRRLLGTRPAHEPDRA